MAATMLERIRAHRLSIGRDPAGVGVWSSYCKSATVDTEKNNRDIIVVATTDDPDSNGEIVLPGGAKPDSYFFVNKAVFLDHWYGHENCIGVMRNARMFPDDITPTGWRVRLSVRSGPLGDDILTATREMGIGSSIGFDPIDGGKPTPDEVRRMGPAEWVHRVWDWVELSLTFIPANVQCRGGVVEDVGEKYAADLERLVVKGLIRPESAKAFGMPEQTPVAPPPGSPARRRVVFID